VPGLLGRATARDPNEGAVRFDTALARMQRHRGLAIQQVDGPGWRLAEIHLATLGQQGRGAAGPAPVVFHGILHNEPALRADLRAPVAASSLGALLWQMYTERSVEFVRDLEGEFCLALFDEASQRLILATDPIGSHPLYWRLEPDGFMFGSDLSALLRGAPGATRLDLRAVADYLTGGVVLGNKTLAQDVQLLDPGTVLTYDVRTGRVTLQPYIDLQALFDERWTNESDYIAAVQAAFAAAVERALAATAPIGLSLSGGLDSRAILSAVDGLAPDLRTYTLGVEGCADQVIAEQLARVVGTRHQYFPIDHSYLDNFLGNMVEMVSLTDGMYLSHGLTEMLAVRALGQIDIGVLLRGHGGELAKAHLAWPLHTDRRVYELSSVDELISYLAERPNLVFVQNSIPLARLLRPDVLPRAGGGMRESLAAVVAGTRLTPAQCCSYLYLRELNRRFTIPSLELFRTRVQVRLPYLDLAFLKVLLGAPTRWRDSTRIHQAITLAGCPPLLKIRNSNTGASADAGPVAEFVFDKINSLLKKLNVRGYRHYHNFDAWMRKGLLDSVESELLAPDARVQAFISSSTVRDLVRETRSGTADRSYVLQVLLNLELWQRENGIEAAA